MSIILSTLRRCGAILAAAALLAACSRGALRPVPPGTHPADVRAPSTPTSDRPDELQRRSVFPEERSETTDAEPMHEGGMP